MQNRRRRARSLSPLTVLAIVGALVAATFTVSLGSGSARAQEASFDPTGEASFPAPTEPPTGGTCEGADTAGPLPSGDQSIVGRVTNGLGAPVADLQVRISTSVFKASSVSTNADGSYVFESLGDGSYLISFFDQGATYQSGFYAGLGATPALTPDGATRVDLSGAGAASVDAVLANESFQTASGRVTQFGGAGLADATVTLASMYFPLPACTDSGADGSYTVTNIRAGAYRLQVYKDGFPNGFYRAGVPGNFTTHYSEATPLTIASDLSGLDLEFPELFTLSGTVADALGTVTGGFNITATETVPGASGYGYSDEESGRFTIDGLPAGQYFVRYDDSYQMHLGGWYAGDGVLSNTPDGAVAVTVPGPEVQLLAEPAPMVSGTVTPLGTPDDTILVNLCNDTEEQNCFSDYAAADGRYEVRVLVPGTYVATVFDYSGTYPSGGFIGTGGTIVWDRSDALEILVADADLGPYDATLPDGGRVAATVVSDGAPMPWAYVEVCLDEFICPDAIFMDDTGAGQSSVMRAGTYYLRAYNSDYSAQYWYVDGQVGSAAFADATPVDVIVGQTVTITFDVPVAVGGTPTDPGDGVEPVLVVLDDGTGSAPASVTFSDVESSGTTTLTTSETSDYPLPSGFQLGLPATYYDISTTAGVVFPAVVCISYGDVVQYMDEANLRLFHFESGAWSDITVPPVDTVNNKICGSTNSLSPFVLGERVPQFTGFFQPVDNNALNKAKAGAGIPVKFSLGGDFGLDIFAEGYPTVNLIGCATGATVDAIEQTVSVGSSSLEYDAATDRYVYRFKSSKAWVGTCQRLTFVFTDGTVRTADFTFTK